MTRKIDVAAAPKVAGTLYPPPYDEPCRKRSRAKLGDAAGLTQFGVNLCRLPPGAWSSQRHWHTHEDEFVYVLEGEVTLVTDDGEEVLAAGRLRRLQGRRGRRPLFPEPVGSRRRHPRGRDPRQRKATPTIPTSI